MSSILTDGDPIPSPRIRDLPLESRPREKLARHGPAALDSAELLALFISSGTRGRSAIEISRELLRSYGSISSLGSLGVSQLAKTHGLGLAKASKLAAAFELGKRAAVEQIERRPLDRPEIIAELFAPQLAFLEHERVVVVSVDSRMGHIGTDVVSIGTINESIAHPREILRAALNRGAEGFILLHNHPSGDANPSAADIGITSRIADAAGLFQIRFHDHIIIGRLRPGGTGYFSFSEHKMM